MEAPSKDAVAAWFTKMGMPFDAVTEVELEGDRAATSVQHNPEVSFRRSPELRVASRETRGSFPPRGGSEKHPAEESCLPARPFPAAGR